MQNHGGEHQRTDRATDAETARHGDAVHEGVQQQADQRGDADCLAHVVRLLAEMKVRADDVLRDVHGDVSPQCHERGNMPPSAQRFGEQVDHRDGDHESRREGEHAVERALAPAPAAHDGGGAQKIRAGGSEGVDELVGCHVRLELSELHSESIRRSRQRVHEIRRRREMPGA